MTGQEEGAMITLYGSNQSRSFRALWALEEVETQYDYKQVKIGSHEDNGTQTESYKQLNFQGKVPTLVDDNIVITESAAILNYIARKFLEYELIPINNSMLRAKYDEVCYFVLSDLEQPLWTFGKHKFVLPQELRLKAINKTTHWEFAKSQATLEHYLNDKEFAVGNHFTMADILIAQTLHWANSFKFDVSEPLLGYTKRMYERSACRRALQKA